MRHPPARRHLSLPVAGTPPLTSLSAVAATGLGTTYNTQRAFSNWEVQISTTGGPTFSVQLQGSLDGQTLVNIGSPITTTGLTNVTSNTPLTMVALNLTALSGGTLTGTIAGTEAPAGSGGGGGGGAVTQSTGAGAAAPWSVELSDGAAFYTAAKDTTLSTTNTELGGLTETAPATDTASSGLNGRLQRVSQRLTSLIALLPAALVGGRLDVNVGATVTPANVALDATVGTTNTEIGGLTETAPATDIASSGLNGRLQRVAQRLTSLIGLFPTALGTTTAANSLPVTLSSDGTFATLEGALTETAPATDTASSGVNGRLQRVAQRLTSLIALLPAALVSGRLDVNLGAAPAIVTIASPTVVQGSQNGAGAASWNVQGAGAQGAAVSGNPLLAGGTDGANAQFLRIDPGGVKTSLGTTTSGNDGASNNLMLQPARTDGTGAYLGVMPLVSNGVTWDRPRNNVDVTLLASAARTTLQNSANITVYNCRAIIVTLDLTASGGAISLTPSINYIDPASGKTIPLLTATTIAATGTFTYWVNMNAIIGTPAPFTKTVQADLGRIITINVAVGNANSQTYSVGYTLIPA